MPRLFASIQVAAPPQTVFRLIDSPDGPLLPVGGPRLVRLESAEGGIYRWEFRRLGVGFRTDSLVTEHRPNERIAFRGVAGWTADADVTLEPNGSGTRLVFRMNYSFPRPVRWLLPGPLIRAGIWHGLNRLKAMAESDPTQAALSRL